MSFPTYTSYRESRVEWLGNIPIHWNIDRLKASVKSCRNGIWGEEPSGGDDDVICVRVADFDRTGFRVQLSGPTLRCVTMKERSGRQLQKGDLLLEKSGGGDKQPVGAVVLYDDDVPAVCSNFVARIELADGMEARFWTYVHAAMYGARLTERAINQTSGIQNLDQSRYFEERVPFPPHQEQTSIAAFLDRETAKIDALVEEQRRLITLLKEKRQAVISYAVTKGLNPSASMKDSGIEWLGEVPAHWDRVQLGRLCRQVSDGPHFSPSYVDDGVLFLSARNVKVDAWSLQDAKFISEEDCAEFDRRIVPERGDVLYTKGGTTGVARVVDFDDRFQVWVHIAVLKLHRHLCDPEFLAYALNSSGCYEQAQLFTRGATNQDLGLTRMVKIWLCLPPLDEQNAIVESLNHETAEIDRLVREVEMGLGLLDERRATLIFAAVTGKIDVRSLVPTQAEAA